MRVERRLGTRTWEATQPELGRRVALRRLEPGTAFDAARWPERPGVVDLYAVTHTADGTYLVMQFIPAARTLAECGRVRAGRRRRWVDRAGAILDGAEHGRLTERDVLVGGDGEVWVTGFGGETREPDGEALARMREAQHGRPVPAAAVIAAAFGAAGLVAVLARGGDGRPRADRTRAAAPPVAAGATAIGSPLAPGPFETVDCEGRPPSGSSTTCTVVLLELDGRPVLAPFNGVARTWTVRGVSGRVALQILRPGPDGFKRFNATRFVEVEDAGATRSFQSDRLVPEGSRIGLEIAPGSGVGIRSGAAGARTARFAGRVRQEPVSLGGRAGESDGEELLLRVDLEPRRARGAPEG